MTERTDKWDKSMCGIWRVKPEEKKMTEQERFEAWLETQDYFQRETGSSDKYLKYCEFDIQLGLYCLKQEYYLSRSFDAECYYLIAPAVNGAWLAWQAAQQKEVYRGCPDGYVLVPVEPTVNMIAIAGKAAGHLILIPSRIRSIYQKMIAAAQEAE